MDGGTALPLRRVALVLLAVGLGLILLDQLLFHIGPSGSYGELLYSYVDVTREGNVPAFWNAALLLLVAVAAAVVAYLSAGSAVGWWLAAALAFVMSLDESVQLHERLVGLGRWVQQAFGFTLPTFGWLIPGVVLAVAGAAVLWVWSGRQPPTTRRGLRLGVVVYGSGVVVVEAIGGAVYQQQDISAGYRALTGVEELLEMSGAAIAAVAVMAALRVTTGPAGDRALSAAIDGATRSAVRGGAAHPHAHPASPVP